MVQVLDTLKFKMPSNEFIAAIVMGFVGGIPGGLLVWLWYFKRLKKKAIKEMKGGENGKDKSEKKLEAIRRETETIRREIRGIEDSSDNLSVEGRRRIPILPSKQSDRDQREHKEAWPSFS